MKLPVISAGRTLTRLFFTVWVSFLKANERPKERSLGGGKALFTHGFLP